MLLIGMKGSGEGRESPQWCGRTESSRKLLTKQYASHTITPQAKQSRVVLGAPVEAVR